MVASWACDVTESLTQEALKKSHFCFCFIGHILQILFHAYVLTLINPSFKLKIFRYHIIKCYTNNKWL